MLSTSHSSACYLACLRLQEQYITEEQNNQQQQAHVVRKYHCFGYSPTAVCMHLCLQEEYIKEEQKNLKRELLRAQEEVKRIQSVPLVIGQFLEMVNAHCGIVGSTTGGLEKYAFSLLCPACVFGLGLMPLCVHVGQRTLRHREQHHRCRGSMMRAYRACDARICP
jgi:hypothetical protein